MQDSPESDPYHTALFLYESQRLIVRNRLQYLLEKLNPRDYVDWSGGDEDINKRFYDSAESDFSDYESPEYKKNATTNILELFNV